MDKDKVRIIILVVWPFLYLFPLSSGLISMGNDFDAIYFSYKKYIFEFFEDNYIPLWNPVEGSGYSLIYNPFASFFYLPSWINFILLKIKGTFSLHDYLLYTICGLSIFNIGLYYWLKRFSFNLNQTFFSVLIISCGLLTTGFLKFPNAVHSFAWFPLIMLGIDKALNKKIKNSFILIFFGFTFLLTAGYPYFVVYSVFLFAFYIFFSYFYAVSFENYERGIKFFLKFIIIIFLPFFLGLIVSSPWLLGVKEVLDLTVDRNVISHEFSIQHKFNLEHVIASWIYPVASNTAGRYSLGILTTIFIASYLLTFLIYKQKNKKELYLFTTSIIFFIFVSSMAASGDSMIFNFMWNKIDFIQQLRTWPRINILLIPFICLILTLAINHLIRTNFLKDNLTFKLNNLLFFTLIFSVILIGQFYFYLNDAQSSYWEVWQKKRFEFAGEILGFPFKNILNLFNGEIHTIFLFLASLIVIYIIKFNENFLKNKFLLLFFLFFTSIELFTISNLQWSLYKWKTVNTEEKIDIKSDFTKAINKSRISSYVHGNEFFRSEAFQINNFESWGNDNHNKIIRKYIQVNNDLKPSISEESLKNFNYFFGMDKINKRIFLTKNINYGEIDDFVNDSLNFNPNILNYKDSLNNYYGNKISINLELKEDGWVSFIDNYDPFWVAYVNGKKTEITKLFGAYKSVKVFKGINKIKFIYKPFNFKILYNFIY
jgi:hypothetical protein